MTLIACNALSFPIQYIIEIHNTFPRYNFYIVYFWSKRYNDSVKDGIVI